MVWRSVRTWQMRSMTRAMRGSFSLTWTPGSDVAMGLYLPRTSAGADGFMSKVSWWLGPPHWCRKMMDLTRAFGASARRAWARPRPVRPRVPTRRRVRRETVMGGWTSISPVLVLQPGEAFEVTDVAGDQSSIAVEDDGGDAYVIAVDIQF